MLKRSFRSWPVAVLVTAWLLAPASIARAAVPRGLPAGASCAALAAADLSATNGPSWGQTLIRGHGAPGGWFGVDVCANAINETSPGGANLSCDRPPADLARTGCAPGRATFDGFGLSFQCVELVARFAAWAFGDAPGDWRGDAPDLWLAGDHPADMTALANGGGTAPTPGDILVWGHANARGAPWPAGPNGSHDGHVAVVESVGPTTVTFVEQNALSGNHNVAREAMTLTLRDGRWSAGNPGGSRVLYGWLRSSRNTGLWPGATSVPSSAVTRASASPTRTAAPAPAALPSLARGVMVSPAGRLTALDWSGGALPAPARGAVTVPSNARPAVSTVDLGAPDGTALDPSATPVVLSSTRGDDVYTVGRDGRVYVAHLAPHALHATWSNLGAPAGEVFAGGVAATTIPGAVLVGTVAADGTLWWRAGPPGSLSDWASIGQPDGVPLVGAPVLAGQPGSGLPLAVALGADGRLYEIEWSASADDSGDAIGNWGRWSSITMPTTSGRLSPPLYVASETPGTHDRIGEWGDGALDLVVRSYAGGVWLVRRAADAGWSATRIGPDGQADQLLAAVAPPGAAGDRTSWLDVFTAQSGTIAQAEVALPTALTAPVPAWTAFDAASSAHLGSTPPTALAVGPRASVLVGVSAGTVAILGIPSALALIAPVP